MRDNARLFYLKLKGVRIINYLSFFHTNWQLAGSSIINFSKTQGAFVTGQVMAIEVGAADHAKVFQGS